MSRRIHRLGDKNDGGGEVRFNPVTTKVFVEGAEIAIEDAAGTTHTPSIPPHTLGDWVTEANATTPTLFVKGFPVIAEDDVDTCGHIRIEGAEKTFTR